jgi:hypothetical protein
MYYGSLYGSNNRLSGSNGGIYDGSLFGDSNILADSAYISYGSLYGQSNTLSGYASINYGSLYGEGNQLYGQFYDGTVIGDYNQLYGAAQTSLNIFGSSNVITGADSNVFVAGDSNTIGRMYDFAVSDTTVTISGDITSYISDGSYTFDALKKKLEISDFSPESQDLCACELLNGTITQILLTSKPSRSIKTLTITRGLACLSTSNRRSRTTSQSFCPNSAFLPESTDITSSSASPSPCKNCTTNGDTVVSSQTTSILG